MTTDFHPDQARAMEGTPTWRLLGLTLAEAGPGFAAVSLPVTPGVLNGLATVHGGILVTLLDSTMAAALNTVLAPGRLAVTSSLNTHFLAPGRKGILTGRGRVVRLGSNLAVTEGTVEDENGTELALATAEFFCLPAD